MKRNRSKRILATILCMVMVLTSNISALAEGEVLQQNAVETGTEGLEATPATVSEAPEEPAPEQPQEPASETPQGSVPEQPTSGTPEQPAPETQSGTPEQPTPGTQSETPEQPTPGTQSETPEQPTPGTQSGTPEQQTSGTSSTPEGSTPGTSSETTPQTESKDPSETPKGETPEGEKTEEETPEEEKPEEPVFSEATELHQDFKDASGQLIQRIKAKLPAGAFEAETSQITMEVSYVDSDMEKYVAGMMEEKLPEGNVLGDYMLYKIEFKVNGEVRDSLEPITIIFEKSGLEITDTKKANVFYFNPKNEEEGRAKDELVEITQRNEMLEYLQSSGQSTADIEDYDLSSIEMKEENLSGKITLEGRTSTIYGCYVEKEEKPEENKEETPEEKPEALELTFEDEQVEVKVSAEEAGIIPEGATLKVVPITAENETKEQYEEVAKQIQEKVAEEEKEVAGFLAYDISFVDEDGKEVEPNGKVKVSMNYKKAELPKEVEENKATDAEVTVYHLEENENGEVKEVVDMAAEQKATVNTLVTTEGAKVQKVEVETDSFSVYAVTWEAQRAEERARGEYTYKFVWKDHEIEVGNWQWTQTKNPTVTAHFVDEEGNDISRKLGLGQNRSIKVSGTGNIGQNSRDERGHEFNQTLSEIGADYSGVEAEGELQYIFRSAYLPVGRDYKDIDDISYNPGRGKYWHYMKSGGWYATDLSNEPDIDVYLVYTKQKETKLETVGTVDLTNTGITMRMKDHSSAGNGIDIGGPYTVLEGRNEVSGKIKPGLVRNTLKNGYPITSKDRGQSLENLFNGKEVNHLFLLDEYERTGYYEYSSFDNYAYLGQEENFTVYNQRGTPSNDDAYFYQRGNFMPYNRIAEGRYSDNSNWYDENGQRLERGDDGYNAPLYLTQGNNNFHFGMSLSAGFYQPKDGMAEHKGNTSPMRYEFNGDDDLWVFIDDVLVLDIGGIHDAHSGYIDFSTGEVGWTDCAKGETPEPFTTNIKRQFEKAGQYNRNDFDGNTFKDYTKHTFKMFYMERGKGASNLHVRFNIQTIPDSQIQVKKELKQETDPVLYGDVDFGFKLYVEEANPETQEGIGRYSQVRGEDLEKYAAKLKGKDGTESALTMDDQGRFYLKPKQTAVFNNIPVNLKYYVSEVDVKSDEFDEVRVNDTTIHEKTEHGDKLTFDATTSEDTVEDRPLVVFENSCTAANLRVLQIEKKIEDNQNSEDTFYMQVKIEGDDGNLYPFSGTYYVFENASDNYGDMKNTKDTNGYIALKKDQIATIYNILSETKFEVTEVDLDTEKYKTPTYKVSNDKNNENSYTEGNSGEIQLKKDAKVIVTNSYKATVSVEKVWKPSAPSNIEGVYVGLYQNKNGHLNPVNGAYALLSEENSWKYTFVGLDGLASQYVVKELHPTNNRGEFEIEGDQYVGVEEGDTVRFDNKNYQVTYEEKSEEGNKTVTITNSMPWQIVKISTGTGTNGEKLKLEGAEFIARVDGEKPYYGRSDGEGVIRWYKDYSNNQPSELINNLPSGKVYEVVETKAPSGYQNAEYSWTVDLTKEYPVVKSNNKQIKSEVVDGITTYYFKNTPLYELPSTGGTGIFVYTIGGTLLLMAAALLIYRMKREEVLKR